MEALSFLLLLTVTVQLSSACYCTLRFNYTGDAQGTHFTAVGLLKQEKIVSYNSTTHTVTPETEWMKKIQTDDPDHWSILTWRLANGLPPVKTKDYHTVKLMYGCKLDANLTEIKYWNLGFDGEDFLSLDQSTGDWTAVNEKALAIKQQWEKTDLTSQKAFLKDQCTVWLQMYVKYRGSTPRSTPENTGSRKRRSVLAKDWCKEQDPSSDNPNLSNDSNGQQDQDPPIGRSVSGIIGVGAVVLIAGVVVGGVGVVIWKKKRDFKPVPENPAPDVENSSINT